ncbi:hypothetical protein ACS0TY_000395 [Phlomoides rotata]
MESTRSSDYKFITPAHSHFGRNRSTNSLIQFRYVDQIIQCKQKFLDSWRYRTTYKLSALGFDGGLKKPPTDALRPIIPDNACILCLTATAGTELADAYSLDTVIASSPGKEVHDPWAFYLHAALLR